MLIQVVLIIAVLVTLVVVIRGGHIAHVQAGKRIGLVLFAVLNIYAVLRPDDLTAVAHLLGVGRGTDLVLYGLVVAFMFGMVNFYLRFRHVDRRLTELARSAAIRDAEISNPERLSSVHAKTPEATLSPTSALTVARSGDEPESRPR